MSSSVPTCNEEPNANITTVGTKTPASADVGLNPDDKG
jgi:hypothetical protein